MSDTVEAVMAAPSAPVRPEAARGTARFVTGSILRHVIVMTLTGALGLMSMFLVDLLDLLFLSHLHRPEITAAIGFAGTIAFASLSLSIGSGIAAAALVARAVGAGNRERAAQFASSSLLFTFLVSGAWAVLTAAGASPILEFLGASGAALGLATSFLWILVPGFVMLGGAVCCSFILRGLGDAARAMYITLGAALVTLVLDPIFIFGFGLGIQGAALANVAADAAALGIGLHGVIRVHRFLPPLRFSALRQDLKPILSIAIPAILAQLATPFANACVTRAVAPFGNEAVTGTAIIGRLVPVAFGIIFSLSGAVGPIIGQNYGARRLDRVSRTLVSGLAVSAVYTLVTSLILFAFRNQVAGLFNATGISAGLVTFFCTFIAVSWAFAGAQFVANATFNNLGHANLSTFFNWSKATVGTIPPAMIGAWYAGPQGVLAGVALGSILFGTLAVFWAFHIVRHLQPAGERRAP